METQEEKKPNLGGRPLAVIDWQKVDAMLHIQCTGEEIASVLDVDYNTIDRHCKREFSMGFEEYAKIKKEGGKASLRRRQWALTETNPAMAIWLGKQWLGQKDKQDPIVVENKISTAFVTETLLRYIPTDKLKEAQEQLQKISSESEKKENG